MDVTSFLKFMPTQNVHSTSGNKSVSTGEGVEAGLKPNDNSESAREYAGVSVKENMLSFINSATPEEADSRVAAYQNSGGASLGPVINLKAIMAAQAAGKPDVVERIHRLSDRFHQESNAFHKQELKAISQGKAEGKTSKEILADLVGLYDKQSEFFKLAIGWEGKQLSDPGSYSKLVELTPDYVNAYA